MFDVGSVGRVCYYQPKYFCFLRDTENSLLKCAMGWCCFFLSFLFSSRDQRDSNERYVGGGGGVLGYGRLCAEEMFQKLISFLFPSPSGWLADLGAFYFVFFSLSFAMVTWAATFFGFSSPPPFPEKGFFFFLKKRNHEKGH